MGRRPVPDRRGRRPLTRRGRRPATHVDGRRSGRRSRDGGDRDRGSGGPWRRSRRLAGLGSSAYWSRPPRRGTIGAAPGAALMGGGCLVGRHAPGSAPDAPPPRRWLRTSRPGAVTFGSRETLGGGRLRRLLHPTVPSRLVPPGDRGAVSSRSCGGDRVCASRWSPDPTRVATAPLGHVHRARDWAPSFRRRTGRLAPFAGRDAQGSGSAVDAGGSHPSPPGGAPNRGSH